jgi:hypothetical protein
MLAEVMKIPDPIIEPATSIVASVSDIALTNPASDPGLDCGVASVETAELLMQEAEKARKASAAAAAAGGVLGGIPQNVGMGCRYR